LILFNCNSMKRKRKRHETINDIHMKKTTDTVLLNYYDLRRQRVASCNYI